MQTSPPLPPPPPLEAAWQTLRTTLEWGEEFGLVFVFCNDARAKQALFQRANALMQQQVRPFERPAAHEAADLCARLLMAALQPAQLHLQTGSPLWLDLDSYPEDPHWNQARQDFLIRLNERRASLMREHTRTVVLTLPLNWTKPAAEAAPDLWTIRHPSIYLDTQGHESEGHEFDAFQTPLTWLSSPATAFTPPPQTALPDVVQRWQISQQSGQAPMSLWDATRACEAALAAGHTALAWDIANSNATRARTALAQAPSEPKKQLELAATLGMLGKIAEILGDLEIAQHAYLETAQLDRHLLETLGQTPQLVHNLSDSMLHLGDVYVTQGRLEDAHLAYRKGNDTNETLRQAFGPARQYWQNRSIFKERFGNLALTHSDLKEAEHAYRESETIRRRLLKDTPSDAKLIRDLSVAVAKLGEVYQQQGRLNDANLAFRESEFLCRQLIQEFGSTPEFLRDLSVEIQHQGQIAADQEEWQKAYDAYTESISVLQKRIADFGKTFPSLLDLLSMRIRLSHATRQLGRLDEAREMLEKSIAELIQLKKQFGETAATLETWADGEAHLGMVLALQQQVEPARATLQHARHLFERLALSSPMNARYKAAIKQLDSVLQELNQGQNHQNT